MKTLWFKNKRYGYGWTPATWQGWIVTLAFIGFIVFNALRMERLAEVSPNIPFPWHFMMETIAAVIVLLVIAYMTGEKPRWQWGDKDEDSSQKSQLK